MGTTTVVSSKFQIVIPKRVREVLGIRQKQEMLVEVSENKVELIPIKKFEELKGAFPELRKGPSVRELRGEWRE